MVLYHRVEFCVYLPALIERLLVGATLLLMVQLAESRVEGQDYLNVQEIANEAASLRVHSAQNVHLRGRSGHVMNDNQARTQ
jgi:hypothetical protein